MPFSGGGAVLYLSCTCSSYKTAGMRLEFRIVLNDQKPNSENQFFSSHRGTNVVYELLQPWPLKDECGVTKCLWLGTLTTHTKKAES
eukprot:954936-Amphidinium_carterae.1